jgi:hypothetical protein
MPASPVPKTTAAPADEQRERSDQRALADQARKEKPMPIGKPSPATLATPKTCRVCGLTKPRDQFPKTGMNAKRCYACAELVGANEEKPLPIKRSIAAKAARAVNAVVPLTVTIDHVTTSNGLGFAQGKPQPINDLLAELEQNRIRRGEILAELHVAIDHLGSASA